MKVCTREWRLLELNDYSSAIHDKAVIESRIYRSQDTFDAHNFVATEANSTNHRDIKTRIQNEIDLYGTLLLNRKTYRKRKREKERSNTIFFPSINEESVIDEHDYNVVCDILASEEVEHEDLHEWINIDMCCHEGRVVTIKMPYISSLTQPSRTKPILLTSLPRSINQLQYLHRLDLSAALNLSNLPEEIGDLKNLVFLHLSNPRITSIPSSIGKLQKLQRLELNYTYSLSYLPEQIGDLKSLGYLELVGSEIVSVPPSIGKLQNLWILNLSNTKKLMDLPEQIGDLKSMFSLELSGSAIRSLPSSALRLKNLRHFHIGSNKNLSRFPEDIGDMTRLERLEISGYNLTLPSTIGRLQNLEQLRIRCEDNANYLPDEVGNLTNLKIFSLSVFSTVALPRSIGNLSQLVILDLKHTKIASLPESIVNLKRLLYLRLSIECLTEMKENDQKKFLLNLVHSLPYLGSFGMARLTFGFKIISDVTLDSEVIYSLACNRAMYRTVCMNMIRRNPGLWPILIKQASRAFDEYSFEQPDSYSNYVCEHYRMHQSDAIYQLLIDGRESFFRLLINRNAL